MLGGASELATLQLFGVDFERGVTGSFMHNCYALFAVCCLLFARYHERCTGHGGNVLPGRLEIGRTWLLLMYNEK